MFVDSSITLIKACSCHRNALKIPFMSQDKDSLIMKNQKASALNGRFLVVAEFPSPGLCMS